MSRADARGRERAVGRAFIERVGIAACMTDARRPGPSLYVAVCGRRDAVLPRNVQTEAGCANRALMAEGYAVMLEPEAYRLSSLPAVARQ